MPLNIPNICQFWDIATLLRPVNSTPTSANQNCTLHTLQRGEGELSTGDNIFMSVERLLILYLNLQWSMYL